MLERDKLAQELQFHGKEFSDQGNKQKLLVQKISEYIKKDHFASKIYLGLFVTGHFIWKVS